MSVFKRGKYFHVEFEWDGKRVQQSSKSTHKNVAVALEQKLRRRLEGGETLDDIKRPKANAPTCAEAIQEYIKANGIRWSKSTLKMHMIGAATGQILNREDETSRYPNQTHPGISIRKG